ncbi:MAG TPA: DUF5683 domain-containing protein [Smithella sp.]|nr:hypothetical protein [Smithella sp.]MDM7987719.1 DUF5683 domain-containing protein [Smithella sp.]HNY49067.1 DUF5683 domain-containing protein [Smithella sp.]HOG90413.1 DUF5683 domain-containing protein [Smithella sp.]HOU50466.1 DUF5683 domain-containing protein [Smithella sp.]
MNLSTRAALLNALLFPGWGHLYLKKYWRGIFIIIGVLVGLLSIVWSMTQVTLEILKTTPVPKGAVNPAIIMDLTMKTLQSANYSQIRPVTFLIIVLWILSIIDAYQLGKKEMAKM